ncbi:hypothetical protein N7524_011033 [Penicillium chrysogenum]|nr:hypothetical protein N7524_011033 [Penicillium chrysogenum]
MRSPRKSATSNYKRAAIFLALIQIRTPSETKIKGYPRLRGYTTERIKGYAIGPGYTILDHKTIKEFLRWYSHLARRKKSKNGRPVITSVLNYAERLFKDRKEISSQADHRIFIPGLLKAIITLALQLYLFTGVRIRAFIPAYKDRDERGLRYKCGSKGTETQTTQFGIGIRNTKRPQFASSYILLATALQHGALYSIKTVKDFARFNLLSGEPIKLH